MLFFHSLYGISSFAPTDLFVFYNLNPFVMNNLDLYKYNFVSHLTLPPYS